MSAEFEAIVALSRTADHVDLQDALLRLTVSSSTLVTDLAAKASAYRQPEIYIEGRQYHQSLADIPSGTKVDIEFDGLTSNSKVLANDLASLLKYQQGLFLYSAPTEYFLIGEGENGYATGDLIVPDLVSSYQRMPSFFALLESLSDVVLNAGTSSPVFVLLSGKRLDIAVHYDIGVLKVMPSESEINSFRIAILASPFVEVKRALLKKVLVRLLEPVQPVKRLEELARRFEAARQAFEADFDLYVTEFNFEKVREGFEQKRLAFVLQLNSTTTDVLGKILAIPIGQGLIVSQLKNDPSAVMGNVALIISSLVFASLAALLLFNQQQSLRQIKLEIQVEDDVVQTRFPQLHCRIEKMFKMLRRRAVIHTWAFPAMVLILLGVTTIYSVYAFCKVPPIQSLGLIEARQAKISLSTDALVK